MNQTQIENLTSLLRDANRTLDRIDKRLEIIAEQLTREPVNWGELRGKIRAYSGPPPIPSPRFSGPGDGPKPTYESVFGQ